MVVAEMVEMAVAAEMAEMATAKMVAIFLPILYWEQFSNRN